MKWSRNSGDRPAVHQRHHISYQRCQNRLSKSLADGSVPFVSPLLSAEVGYTSNVGVGGIGAAFVLSPFFLLPNETPKLLAKLAKVPLAVVPVDGPANGDVRGAW